MRGRQAYGCVFVADLAVRRVAGLVNHPAKIGEDNAFHGVGEVRVAVLQRS